MESIETMPYGNRKFTIADPDGNELGFVQEGYAQAEGIAFAEERLRAFWRETFDVVELRRARTSWESGYWYRCVFQKRRRPLQALAIRNR